MRNLTLSFFSSVIANQPKQMKQSRCMSLRKYLTSFKRKDCVAILICHCERTIVRVAIFILSKIYEIASLITFARKDITAQSRKRESIIFLSLRGHAVTVAIFLLTFLTLPSFAFAEEKIPVFPSTLVEAYTVYGSLALFWLAIIFLIIVIKMKLNEIERIQKLGIDEENENATILE
jgi:hypothetical protein